MRLKSGIWVAAYMRRCSVEGAFAVVRRRGADEAGAVFIMVNRLDGTVTLYGPAPQSLFDEAQPAERMFTAVLGAKRRPRKPMSRPASRAKSSFDPDVWMIEVEDRAGRHFLDHLAA